MARTSISAEFGDGAREAEMQAAREAYGKALDVLTAQADALNERDTAFTRAAYVAAARTYNKAQDRFCAAMQAQ